MLPRPPAPSLMLLFASLALFLLLARQGMAMPAAETGLNNWLLRQACEPAAPWYRTPSLLGVITSYSIHYTKLYEMCQPGRPGPQGDSQVGSPGLDIFQSTKSSGLCLASSTLTRAPACN